MMANGFKACTECLFFDANATLFVHAFDILTLSKFASWVVLVCEKRRIRQGSKKCKFYAKESKTPRIVRECLSKAL